MSLLKPPSHHHLLKPPLLMITQKKDTCLLFGKGLRHCFEGLRAVSENNPKLRLVCLTSCMLNLKNKGYNVNAVR